jgi:hypothetical protein
MKLLSPLCQTSVRGLAAVEIHAEWPEEPRVEAVGPRLPARRLRELRGDEEQVVHVGNSVRKLVAGSSSFSFETM